jgi:hypothetical protein
VTSSTALLAYLLLGIAAAEQLQWQPGSRHSRISSSCHQAATHPSAAAASPLALSHGQQPPGPRCTLHHPAGRGPPSCW